jgi:hypothetical protein
MWRQPFAQFAALAHRFMLGRRAAGRRVAASSDREGDKHSERCQGRDNSGSAWNTIRLHSALIGRNTLRL